MIFQQKCETDSDRVAAFAQFLKGWSSLSSHRTGLNRWHALLLGALLLSESMGSNLGRSTNHSNFKYFCFKLRTSNLINTLASGLKIQLWTK